MLQARLSEYDVGLKLPAHVWASVRQPDGSRSELQLHLQGQGQYQAHYNTARSGVYQFLLHAQGYSSGNVGFTREKLLTASVWFGNHDGSGSGTSSGGDGAACSCKTMLCLLEMVMKSDALRARAKEMGLDLNALYRCIKTQAIPHEGPGTLLANAHALLSIETAAQLSHLAAAVADGGETDLHATLASASLPVKRKAKMPGTQGSMFPKVSAQSCEEKE